MLGCCEAWKVGKSQDILNAAWVVVMHEFSEAQHFSAYIATMSILALKYGQSTWGDFSLMLKVEHFNFLIVPELQHGYASKK